MQQMCENAQILQQFQNSKCEFYENHSSFIEYGRFLFVIVILLYLTFIGELTESVVQRLAKFYWFHSIVGIYCCYFE